MLENIRTVSQGLVLIAGGISIIATLLAHVPFMPAKWAVFFARLGAASGKFSVAQKDVS